MLQTALRQHHTIKLRRFTEILRPDVVAFFCNTSSIAAKPRLISTQNLLANRSCSIMWYCLHRHNLILISSVNPHIPRYIEQDAHLAELQQQRCAAITEKRQRRTGYRHDAGDNEQVHQRLDRQLGSDAGRQKTAEFIRCIARHAESAVNEVREQQNDQQIL